MVGRQEQLLEELTEWWEDLWQRGIGSRVILAGVPSGWGRTTVLDAFTEIISRSAAPVTLIARINGTDLPSEPGLQAEAVRQCLLAAAARHPAAELLGLDRLAGTAQTAVGVAALFYSGLAAGISFLLAGVAISAVGKAWDATPAGQDGPAARTARAVAAVSVQAPVVVIVDDADRLHQDLALTVLDNLAARYNGQVLVIAAVNPGSELATALTAQFWYGTIARRVHTADTNPDMGGASRAELLRELFPGLPDAAIRRIAHRTRTFAEVFAVTAAPRLAELSKQRRTLTRCLQTSTR